MPDMIRYLTLGFVVLSLCLGGLTACGNTQSTADFPTERGPDDQVLYGNERPSIFGPDGLQLFSSGSKGDDQSASGATGIGVNAYLWRASLDTVSFMPINSADPFGGTIITDWYQPDTANTLSEQTDQTTGQTKIGERFKLNIFIQSQQLRADGVRVSAFRQIKSDDGWTDADISPDIADKLELAILSRARDLRRRDLSAN